MGSMLDEGQVARYREDGFLLVKQIFDAATRAAIIEQLNDLAARRAEFPAGAFVMEPAFADGAARAETPLDEVRKFQSLQSLPQFRRFFGPGSAAREMTARLMDANDLRIQFLSCFAKPARHGSETPWHQDQALWPLWMPTATSCWVALDEATLENGCIQFARASHEGGMEEHVLGADALHEHIPGERAQAYEVVPVVMEPGDGVFFGGRVWHHSEPNCSPRRRLGMPVVYVSEAELQRAFACSAWIDGRQKVGRSVIVGEQTRRQYQDATRVD